MDERLFIALVYVESRFDPSAVSRKGAIGLTQILPPTAADVCRRHGASSFDTAALYDPDTNLRVGAMYLKEMLDRFPDTRLALAAYNGGPTAVEEWMSGRPDTGDFSTFPKEETRRYVDSIEEAYDRLGRFARVLDLLRRIQGE